jgi:riboflavin kinase/FMN adenylyltransferase
MLLTHGAADTALPPVVLTVGNFDGIHRGHQAMLGRLVEEAKKRGLASCVLTFEPHPREFFSPQAAPTRLTSLREKCELLAARGVERVHVQRFTRSFASIAPEAFIEQVLAERLKARWVLVGEDFRFGAKRAGDIPLLKRLGERCGYEVQVMPAVTQAGARVSSSAVRAALKAGDLRAAERLLGHPYTISGRVAHGAKLGRSLGFPTANIVLRRAPPLAGIFVVEVEGFGPGVASLGRRPTVNPVPVPLLEVHLFECERELYGEHLRVRFLEKLRDEEKYDGLDALKTAIARDARQAREYFARHG